MAEPFYSDYLLDREPDAAGRQLSQLIWGIFLTPVMLATADLGIAGVLADKALTAEEIAAAAGTDPDATGRLLRAAVATGLLAADSSGRFTLTEMGNWLRPDVSSLADMAGFWQPSIVNALSGVADHVRTGRKVDPAAPGGVWEDLSNHPQNAVRFSRAMSFVTSRVLTALTAAGYRPPACQRIVDVGGNRGTLLAWLLKTVPEATGVLFDLPASLAAAPDYLAVQGVADRTELVAGSFLSEVPAGDLHVLSNVLHNWDDENVRLLAGNCARSVPPGGWLIIIEPVLPSGPEPALGHLMDILMMTMSGGRERTREEHQALIEPAGYAFTRDAPLPLGSLGTQAPWRVLEFRRL
jgi:SAM-dependent methyltransferase